MFEFELAQPCAPSEVTFQVAAKKRARVIYLREGIIDTSLTFYYKPENGFVNWQYISKLDLPRDGRWYEYDNAQFYALGRERTLLVEPSLKLHGSEYLAPKILSHYDIADRRLKYYIFAAEDDEQVNATVIFQQF